MLPATIIDRARRQTATSSSYYTDAMAYQDLNDVKNDVWSTIVTYVNEDLYYQEWTVDTWSLVIWQSEYTLPPIASDISWAKKIKDIKIAYNSTPYTWTSLLQYVKAKRVGPASLPFPWSYYVQYQDPLRPIYWVADNSLFIAPALTTITPAAIVINWIRSIVDYTPSTTEAQMIIPLDQQKLLIFWLIPYIYNQKVMSTEEANATAKYEQLKQQMIWYLTERVISPFENQYPDDMAMQVQWNNNFIITL